jgi:hypothetical protein
VLRGERRTALLAVGLAVAGLCLGYIVWRNDPALIRHLLLGAVLARVFAVVDGILGLVPPP